jgi:serine/threonine protein kinase
VNGRGLLAIDSRDELIKELLKRAGMNPKHRNLLLGTKTESGVLDKKEGLPFWELVAQQLGQQDVVSSVQSQENDFDRSLMSYDFVRTLGNGAYGVVYQMKHRSKSIDFALKDQRPPSMKEMVEMQKETKLQQEAAKGQGRTFVVHCYNPFEVGLRFCMPLEFCQGGELGKWVEAQTKENKFSQQVLGRMLMCLLEGLVHLHSVFIIHRGE